MACNSCEQVVEFGRSGLEYVRSSRDLTDRYGNRISLVGSVVKSMHPPIGGWGVRFFVNDIQVTFEGGDPKTIFTRVSENFKLNNVAYTEADLWFNLNIQWLERQPKKYRVVSYEDFLSLADSAAFSDPKDIHAKSVWHPEEWQNSAFSFLALYLATDTYKYADFILLVNHLLSMYNPTRSTTTGSSSKYMTFTAIVKKLKDDPQYEVIGARHWLFAAYVIMTETKKDKSAYFNENHWS